MIKKVGRQAGKQAARQRELSMHTISIAIDSKWKKKSLDYISMFSQAVTGASFEHHKTKKKKTQKTRGFWERSLLLILLKPPKLLASNRKRLDVGPETEIATVISS